MDGKHSTLRRNEIWKQVKSVPGRGVVTSYGGFARGRHNVAESVPVVGRASTSSLSIVINVVDPAAAPVVLTITSTSGAGLLGPGSGTGFGPGSNWPRTQETIGHSAAICRSFAHRQAPFLHFHALNDVELRMRQRALFPPDSTLDRTRCGKAYFSK